MNLKNKWVGLEMMQKYAYPHNDHLDALAIKIDSFMKIAHQKMAKRDINGLIIYVQKILTY